VLTGFRVLGLRTLKSIADLGCRYIGTAIVNVDVHLKSIEDLGWRYIGPAIVNVDVHLKSIADLG
jgi:formiminotetrahydrofolate cyclodeaminase